MEDETIIDLYFAREERAISETGKKYGSYCRSIAFNILHSHEDTEECVSDTYLHTWNTIPPTRPGCLRAFLGRITRNLSFTRWEAARAQKRGGKGMQGVNLKDADFVEERRVRTAQTKEDTAQAILNVLAESKLGSMPSTQLRAEVMKEMGCSDRTYERAYADMIRKGELHKRQIMQKNGEREVTKKNIRQRDGRSQWHSFLYCSRTNDKVPN